MKTTGTPKPPEPKKPDSQADLGYKGGDQLPAKMESFPETGRKFEDLPDDLKEWLQKEHDRLGKEGVLNQLATLMVINSRLSTRLKSIDAMLKTGSRKDRRARAKKLARMDTNVFEGL